MLACPPSHYTLEFAEEFLDRAKNPSGPSGLTWADILKEEPFEGQHWQGAVGLPPGSIVGQEEPDEGYDSSPTLTSISDSEMEERGGLFTFYDSEDLADTSEQVLSPPSSVGATDENLANERIAESFRIRLELEALQRRQYWKRTWKPNVDIDRAFDLGDPSTLSKLQKGIQRFWLTLPEQGPAFEKAIGSTSGKSRFKIDDQVCGLRWLRTNSFLFYSCAAAIHQ